MNDSGFRFVVALLIASVLASHSVAADDDLLSNPGFESGLEGWTVAHAGKDDPDASYATVFLPHRPAVRPADAAKTLAAEAPHGGKQCVKYEKRRGASRNNHLDQIINVKPAAFYTLSAWVKSDGRLTPLLSVEDMAWKPVAQVKCGASTDWRRVSVTFGAGKRSQVRIVWYGGSKGRRYEGFPGKSWMDDVEVRPANAEEIKALEAESRTDTAGWFDLALRWDEISPAPLLTINGIQDPPAGKRGFVTARDGHLYFADGQRARFWGVCICGRAAFPTHPQAEIIAARLAKWGMNIVRLHALEVQIFDETYDNTRHLSVEMLDRLDYFVAQLKQRGIYIFLDWRTAWRTRKGDGLGPKWLYEWAMLDDRFVDLNQNYARLLYLHENPYTGNRFIEEPAVVAVEIVNEHDIFTVFTGKQRDDPDAARLKAALKERWNRWLLQRYGDRAGLAKAWTNAAGRCGIRADEDPAANNVEIPLPAHALGPWQRDYTAPTGSARGSDALLFLYEVQTSYFLRMRDFLRGLGVRVPVSGTNWHMEIRPNARSNAQMDFTENHCYWDHAQPWGPSRKGYTRVQNSPMLRQDPIAGEGGLIERLGRGRVPGKPFFVTEWNYDSPNEYRCEGPVAMAAYGALQDWDGILCYCFYGNWGTPWDKADEESPLGMFLGSEEIFNDPSIICQFPAAAALFLRGDVRPAQRVVDIGYSAADTFYAQGYWGRETAQFAFLPFLHRVQHCYFGAPGDGDEYTGDADVVISSGLSASGSYVRAKHAILLSDNPAADLHNKTLGRDQLVKPLYPQLKFENLPATPLDFKGIGWPLGNLEAPLEPGIHLDTVPSGAVPIGVADKTRLCLGFINDRYCIAPGATVLGEADESWFYRLFTTAMRHWKLAGDDTGALASDTGELSWNWTDGVLTVNSPRTQSAVGFLAGKTVKLADIQINARTRHGAITLTSVDGRPIRESRRLLLTAIARSENTGQSWQDGRTTVPAEGRGSAPVLAEPVDAEVTLTWLAGGRKPTALSLDATGKPKGPLSVTLGPLGPILTLDKPYKSVFYSIELGD